MGSALTTAAVLAIALSAGAQSTWYVDLNAAPPGSGTQASPYASIQYAIDQASTAHGDTLIVLPGTYVEQVVTGAKRITLKSVAGPLATTITTSLAGAVVRLGQNITPGAVLDGFTVTSTNAASWGVVANSGTVRRCIVHGTGIGVRVLFDGWVESCTVTGNSVGVEAELFAGCAFCSNSIVWGNGLDVEDDTGCSSFDHCIVDSMSTTGEAPTYTGADPNLWDAAGLDLHLRPGSPAIDGGDPAAPHDNDGSVIDIGALTYDPTYAPAPAAYCTSKLNSLGCTPAIGAVGTASATGASPFLVVAGNELSHRLGLLFYGYAPMAAPYQGGWMCVQQPHHRTAVQDSGGSSPQTDCSGVFSYDFRARIQSGADAALAPGEFVYCQFWSRDPGVAFQTVRTDALRFGIAP